MRCLACRLSMRAKHTQRCGVRAKTIAQERENSQTFSICFEKSPGVFLFPVLLRVRPRDFCAVSGGSRLLSASPTWENADTGWRFGPILPAKPPSSCKWGSLTLKVAHEAVQLRCRRGDAEHIGASAECGDRNTLAE